MRPSGRAARRSRTGERYWRPQRVRCVDAERQPQTRSPRNQRERRHSAAMLMTFKNKIAIFGRSSGGGHLLPIKASLAALVGIIVLVTMFVVQILSEGQSLTDYYTAMARSLEAPAQI